MPKKPIENATDKSKDKPAATKKTIDVKRIKADIRNTLLSSFQKGN